EAAARDVARRLVPGALLVLESTVPPGTTERVLVGALRAAGVDPEQVAIVHCPERVIPGDIVRELRENARVVGGRMPGDAERAAALYATFCKGRISTTDLVTAELSKVMENTYRDVNIALANEFALLCEELGVDVYEAIALANQHPRVDILHPGPGVGGHCIPIDPQFLVSAHPLVTELIQASRRVNERMPHIILRRIVELVPPDSGACVALLGAAYKANVDDTRESPTEYLEALLLERGYVTRVYDPLAERYVRPLTATLEQAVQGSDAIVLLAGHDAFAGIDPYALAPLCRRRNLVDTRAFFPAQRWTEAGFTVYTLGRGWVSPQPLTSSA
ncbi:MAG: nucleotide sugar dehydrogenase, partial [Candidatus Baltobacteraceae bacterium]